MTLINLPSVSGAKTIEEVIDVVENMRKQMEYLFNNVQNDNINGVISSDKIVIGADSTFNPGYNPGSKVELEAFALEMADIYNKLDGTIESWFYQYDPLLTNGPADLWLTEIDKEKHVGDTFTNIDSGLSWRYLLKDGSYQWVTITDTDALLALELAGKAQDTADSKRRVFIVTPFVPYDAGDLWMQGSAGDVMVCATARNTGNYLASDWVKGSKYTDDASLANYVTSSTYGTDQSTLQEQLDGKVETWFYSGVPTLVNAPTSAWTTTVLKNNHINDLYYDLATKKAYRYRLISTTYSWELLQDASIQTALDNASTAQDTADGKMQVFVVQPTTPYDVGDLWAGGTSSDLMKCKAARATGSYVAADWEKAVKYTDDSSLANYVTSSTYGTGQSTLQGLIDGKIETWFYSGVPTLVNVPTSTWTDIAAKDKHIGDLYFDTATKKVYRFKVATGTYSWELMQDTSIQSALANASTAQSTADSKMEVFTSQPVPPYDIGDLWVGGVTGDIKKCKIARATGSYVATDWDIASKYTDDTAVANLIIGGRNLILDTSQARTKLGSGWVYNGWKLSDGLITGDYILSFKYTVSVANAIGVSLGVDGVWDNTYELLADLPVGTDVFFSKTVHFDRTVAMTHLAFYTNQDITVTRLQLEKGNKVSDWTPAIEDIQGQLDGKIETWFYSGVPTLVNAPANAWTTTTDKDKHINDLYYNLTTKIAYRFKLVSTTYSWEVLQDTSIQSALDNASTAQDTADGKMQVFIVQPTTPYGIGDLWAQGVAGDILTCIVTRATGAYVAADWKKAGNRSGTYIDATGVYTGKVVADQITGGTITGVQFNSTSSGNTMNITGSKITSKSLPTEDWYLGKIVEKWAVIDKGEIAATYTEKDAATGVVKGSSYYLNGENLSWVTPSTGVSGPISDTHKISASNHLSLVVGGTIVFDSFMAFKFTFYGGFMQPTGIKFDAGNSNFRLSAGGDFEFLKNLDASWATVKGIFASQSERSAKKNIEVVTDSYLNNIETTPVYRYHYLGDSDTEFKRLGVILDEAPPEIVEPKGEAIELYAMVSYLWKGVQELSAKVKDLESEIVQLKTGAN